MQRKRYHGTKKTSLKERKREREKKDTHTHTRARTHTHIHTQQQQSLNDRNNGFRQKNGLKRERVESKGRRDKCLN